MTIVPGMRGMVGWYADFARHILCNRSYSSAESGAYVSVSDDCLAHNAAFAASYSGPLPLAPAKKLAVLACMDARLNVYDMLGLREGEAHVIRNAGGAATDDAIRSLAVSQRVLQTREIILIHHTDCGMLSLTDDVFKRRIQDETGIRPPWAAEFFTDLEEDVRQTIRRITASPFVPHIDAIRGFVFDVATGRLREVPFVPASRRSGELA